MTEEEVQAEIDARVEKRMASEMPEWKNAIYHEIECQVRAEFDGEAEKVMA